MYSAYWKGQWEPKGNLSNPYLWCAQNWPTLSPAEPNVPRNSMSPNGSCPFPVPRLRQPARPRAPTAFSRELLATKPPRIVTQEKVWHLQLASVKLFFPLKIHRWIPWLLWTNFLGPHVFKKGKWNKLNVKRQKVRQSKLVYFPLTHELTFSKFTFSS